MSGLPPLPALPRLPQNGPVLHGAVSLEASQLKTRVGEIIAARMREGFSTPSIVERVQVIQRAGTVSMVDVGVVRAEVEKARWKIVSTLRSIGLDVADGEIEVDEGAAGAMPNGDSTAVFILKWTPKAKA